MGSLVFLALLLGVMYFILIRPQQRQMKEQQARIRSLEAGMIVVTNSGIHGASPRSRTRSSGSRSPRRSNEDLQGCGRRDRHRR